MLQQRLLDGQAAGVARQRAVAADHAVARDDDRDLIAPVGPPDRPGARAELARELPVGRRLAVGNVPQARPDGLFERRALLSQRELEGGARTAEVLVQLALGLGQD